MADHSASTTYFATTLATVRNEVLALLGDSAGTVWSTAQIESFLKEGFLKLCFDSLLIFDWDTLSLTATYATYSLPTQVLKMERVTYDSIRLEPLTSRYLAETLQTYQTMAGTIWAYAMDQDGLGTIRFVNVPQVSGTSPACKIEYFRRGRALTSSTVTVELPARYIKYLEHYALWRAYEIQGTGQFEPLATLYKSRFLDDAARIKRRKRAIASVTTPGFGPSGGERAQNPRPAWPSTFGWRV